MEQHAATKVAAVILAAGRASRMGGTNKLTADVGGLPVVRRVALACLRSKAEAVYVVTGHRPEEVREALAGLSVNWAHNPDYARGLSTSLAAGLTALPEVLDAAVVCLADMPGISSQTIDRLIRAFDPDCGHTICVPEHDGRRGNPVLFARRHFSEIGELSGDVGARALIERHAGQVRAIDVPDASVLTDIDTVQDLAAKRSAFASKQFDES